MDKFLAINEMVNRWDISKKPLYLLSKSFFQDFPNLSSQDAQFILKHARQKINNFIYLRFFDEFADKNLIFPRGTDTNLRSLFFLFTLEDDLLTLDAFVDTHLPHLKTESKSILFKTKLHFKKFEEDIKKRSPLKKQLYVLHSFSRNIVDLWVEQFGEKETKRLMEALHKPGVTSVRVNQTVCNRKELRKILEEEGIFSVPSRNSESILHIRNPEKLFSSRTKAENDGYFLIQDEGEFHINELLPAPPKALIVDLHPQNGRFTISFALDAHPRAKIFAICRHQNTLHKMVERIKPFKIPQLDLKVLDSNKDIIDDFGNQADAVIVHPKTSGMGRIRTEPEFKWNVEKNDFFKFQDQQFQQLTLASRLVKNGGKILYFADTINIMETEKLISKFLLQYGNFKRVPFKSFREPSLNKSITPDGAIIFKPYDFEFNTYFAAVLEKFE